MVRALQRYFFSSRRTATIASGARSTKRLEWRMSRTSARSER